MTLLGQNDFYHKWEHIFGKYSSYILLLQMNHFILKEIDIKLLCIGGFLGCPLRSVFSGVITRTAKKFRAAIIVSTFILAKRILIF